MLLHVSVLHCDPMDCSPPSCSVHGIFQATIPEWAAISLSKGSSQLRDRAHICCIGWQILYHWATWEALRQCWTVVQVVASFCFLASSVLLLLLSHFSRVQLCVTPQTAAHQAPPSLGFSRQEHWSGLPFPSLMHESEKWKWNRSVMSDSSWPRGLQPTRFLHPWDSPGKSMEWGASAFSKPVVYDGPIS